MSLIFAKRAKRPTIEMTKLSSLIAEDVEIDGDLSFSGGIRIDGCIKGHVSSSHAAAGAPSLLVLSDKGRIEGTVRCGDAVINGCVVGDLDVAHFLELQSSARVTGTIRYQHLQMDVGATVQGQLIQAAPVAMVDNVVEMPMEKAGP
jgi:cytoskeletal protein CcmA (bactofilin family)